MENENRKNYPYGRKAAEGFAAPGQQHDATNSVGCRELGIGLLSMEPLGATKSSPYMPPAGGEKSRR
jgi:hypothetical protein